MRIMGKGERMGTGCEMWIRDGMLSDGRFNFVPNITILFRTQQFC